MAYAQVDPDLVKRWRALSPDEVSKAEVLLDDAAFWLRVWVPGLGGAIAAAPDSDAAKAAKLLSVAMVKRAMIAEDSELPGAQSVQETAGVFGETIVFRNPDGDLFLYARELSDILAVVTGAPQGAVSYTSPGL